ncbi:MULTISPECIES: NADPH-dependent FMN reductase [Thermomonospora]|uniref:NADPH-dependent FMN reductase n=1 Tax=Thermomonospora curvata (strain ATCC 19995 / DSM 43183 / JCM 3096 / KCTC 9072 / NBRC 15933 / NCIMB 10081 / Henssen B9) TaxID=471852 RepID=D1A5I1_THECD|nr:MULTISPECIES: NAD(P)H-dependent oxidoreductase [Thermomonospora]ACY96341.1 NADPH-dependent FMN reductase [Thermomonospora curvata DSM 43183]PKK15746.1 MAG: NADPH-dependent oxidoreductase [Thermomonospora sp. CIF 1]
MVLDEGGGPLRVAVIVGSTREGRIGDGIRRWFTGLAERRADIAVQVVDLAEHDLPARLPGAATPQMTGFAELIGRAEGFVVVTPEYNRSFPASLKQAIDCVYDEWLAKPVGLVSYGYRSAGLHAAEQLRSVFTGLHMVSMCSAVHIDLRGGDPARNGPEHDAAAMLDQLVWWGLALREARAARPYVC